MRKFIIVTAALLAIVGCRNKTSILDLNPADGFLPELVEARGDGGVTLLQFSDLHGSSDNLGRIVAFYDAYDSYIDDAIHLGDVVAGYWHDENPMAAVKGARRILNTVGNHDCWKGYKLWSETNCPYDATQSEAYEKILEGPDPEHPMVAEWAVSQPSAVADPSSPCYRACYYYKDYPEACVRLAVLDCVHYSDAQAEWFAAVLDGALEKGLTVMAATHYPPVNGIHKFTDTAFSTTWAEIGPVEAPSEGQMERMPDDAYSKVDSFILSGGHFAAWLSGHEHFDVTGLVPGHEPQLVLVVDKGGDKDDYMKEDRTKGTVNQDSFNLVTVNPAAGLLTVQRIGCTTDEENRTRDIFKYKINER